MHLSIPRCISTDINKLFESYQTAFVELFLLPSLKGLAKVIGKEDMPLEKEIDKNIDKINKKTIAIAIEKIKTIFEKEKEIDAVELFNDLSELSHSETTRSRMDDFYHETVKKNEENRKPLSEKRVSFFVASEVHPNMESNDETIQPSSSHSQLNKLGR